MVTPCPQDRDKALSEGRQCKRKCRTDADCISARKKCLCDGICGRSCIRPDILCPELSSIPNGRVKVGSVQFGGRATFTCDETFFMSGAREISCQGDGSWWPQPPLCTTRGEASVAHIFIAPGMQGR
ncbi:hypothetical protein LAZ67_20001156 [Cordylochernes scorpioides]|uniref:Sushi domain-containing protein n=1 Tax=Cordylochernes scorpioides TaxID=51811 RepID=A0ABY6LNX5_9ARAC|nr:hypothetical protein LAZ67_20001156 [Cordylochernes scorpioides]